MRCLWLTWIDPLPEHDGQRIYSGRLIEAVASEGVEVDVLCFECDQSPRRDGDDDDGVRWWLVPQEPRAAWQSFFSKFPHITHRSGTWAMRHRFRQLLGQRRWDVVVMDGLYPGWALQLLQDREATGGKLPRLIYISHNHEETTRANVASNFAGNFFKSRALFHDARKAAELERRMVDRADAVTAITMEDAGHFAARVPEKPILTLSPGYAGRRLAARRIGPELPRRALLVGSFEWLAKQMNLREFLAVADPVFAEAGMELQVVGSGEEAFFKSLRRELKGTEIVGPVDDLFPYLDQARIAIVPERSGGGFKLKILDYIFNRLPVAALDHSLAGVPLELRDSVLTFDQHEELVAGVVAAMDDFDRLNRLQEQAFTVCADIFDWSTRGRTLMSVLREPVFDIARSA
ncbi:MAG: glycosyltransferase [Parvibaculum sp.]|uniref:glycosyltransferase n=1 Tax=Parvibaculum sp. TaxID=2024848 RepID=UPI0025D19392|nr:glycosyltransferase [Parvibaculum sp.]MCE9650956.1 glycosyltransferase [Parvibaculum sp.]